MRYFFVGIIAGIIINLFVFIPETGIGIYPVSSVKLHSIKNLKASCEKRDCPNTFFVKYDGNAVYFDRHGSLMKKFTYGDSLTSFSANGKYYVSYSKTCKEIEFFNSDGARFWKMDSREYPYLSSNGEIILLMNGDQSRIRFVDINGTPAGVKEISGRLCTVISFSKRADFAAVGFLDGSYYILNKAAEIIFTGRTKQSQAKLTIVKNIAVSENGLFAAIHYGNTEKDYLKIISIADKEVKDIPLSQVFTTKTGLHVALNGETAFLTDNYFEIYCNDTDPEARVSIPPMSYGTSSIDYIDGFYSVSYRKKTGESFFFFYSRNDGVVFFREFPSESYLVNEIKGDTIFLRGSDNLYLYSYHL